MTFNQRAMANTTHCAVHRKQALRKSCSACRLFGMIERPVLRAEAAIKGLLVGRTQRTLSLHANKRAHMSPFRPSINIRRTAAPRTN